MSSHPSFNIQKCVLCDEWFDPEIDGGTFTQDGYMCAIGFAISCEADES